jgi:hypothetical protein
MLSKFRSLAVTLVLISAVAVAGPTYAKGKAHQAQKAHQRHNHSGKALLGAKIHTDGPHVMDKVGKNTVTAVVKHGKVATVKVKNSDKGDVAVKKYKSKSTEKLGQAGGAAVRFASYDSGQLAQDEGWTWIGYSFIDDYGDEQIYWFPYDEVYDPETDAILYVPAEY